MHKSTRAVSTYGALAVTLLTLVGQSAGAASVIDNFEAYTLGNFPSPTWQDVATVLPELPPLINATLPSATVVNTTDAHGNPTQAMQTVNALGVAKGIYTPVPISSNYSLFADIRTVQYANTSADLQNAGPASDWSMQLTFAQANISNFDNTPQAGIYASSQTQGWRLYLISSNGGPTVDIDLGVSSALGIWYSVALDIDATTGTFHSIISDTASGTPLGDQTNVIAGWLPQFAVFDSIAFLAGEVAATAPATLGSTTLPNIAQVDNINISTTPVPLPAPLGLLGVALAGVALARRCSNSA